MLRYDPIQKFGPQDCVGRINGIVDNIDMIFASGDEAAIHKMKALFGFEALKDNRDFAYTIAFPLGGPMNYPTNTWQELNWYFSTTNSHCPTQVNLAKVTYRSRCRRLLGLLQQRHQPRRPRKRHLD